MKTSKAKRTALAVLVFFLMMILLAIVCTSIATITNSGLLVFVAAIAILAGGIYLIWRLKKG